MKLPRGLTSGSARLMSTYCIRLLESIRRRYWPYDVKFGFIFVMRCKLMRLRQIRLHSNVVSSPSKLSVREDLPLKQLRETSKDSARLLTTPRPSSKSVPRLYWALGSPSRAPFSYNEAAS